MLNKKLLSLIIALLMTFGFIFSLSSCMYAVDILTGEEDAGEEEHKDDGKKEDKKEDTSQNTPPLTSTGSSQDTETPPEGESHIFHPGANNPEDIETLSPEMRALLSTVAVKATFDVSSYPYYGSTVPYTSDGSGIIYKLDREKGDAYIITNYHVVYNSGEVNTSGFSDTINLYLYGMEHSQYVVPAKVIGGSMNYDIAVLKVEGSAVLKNSMATEAALADSEKVRVFDNVYVIGNPEGYGVSVTDGIISVESEALAMIGADGRTSISVRVMRTSAAINKGNSGGGLYSTDGKLIGIVNAKRTENNTDNIGYAIPINLVTKVANNILRNCDGKNNISVKKCLIGLDFKTASSGLVSDGAGNLVIVEKVGVASVKETCITDEIQVGDIINSITVDGSKTEVTRVHHITDKMLDASPGSVVVINLTRANVTFDVTITLPESCVSVVK